MKQTVVEGALTKNKLKQIIENEDSLNIEKIESKFLDSFVRFEFFVIHRTTGKKIVVQFNDYRHYKNPKTVLEDKYKKNLCKQNKIKFVEIPYWVQLNNKSFQHYFGFKPSTSIVQDYPHGFIDDDKLMPAGFCSLGVSKFVEELVSLPEKIQQDVWESVYERIYLDLNHPVEVLPIDLVEEDHFELYKMAHEDIEEFLQEEKELQNSK